MNKRKKIKYKKIMGRVTHDFKVINYYSSRSFSASAWI